MGSPRRARQQVDQRVAGAHVHDCGVLRFVSAHHLEQQLDDPGLQDLLVRVCVFGLAQHADYLQRVLQALRRSSVGGKNRIPFAISCIVSWIT